jgi:hypothetical protein
MEERTMIVNEDLKLALRRAIVRINDNYLDRSLNVVPLEEKILTEDEAQTLLTKLLSLMDFWKEPLVKDLFERSPKAKITIGVIESSVRPGRYNLLEIGADGIFYNFINKFKVRDTIRLPDNADGLKKIITAKDYSQKQLVLDLMRTFFLWNEDVLEEMIIRGVDEIEQGYD